MQAADGDRHLDEQIIDPAVRLLTGQCACGDGHGLEPDLVAQAAEYEAIEVLEALFAVDQPVRPNARIFLYLIKILVLTAGAALTAAPAGHKLDTMCGRYDLSGNIQDVLRIFGIELTAEADWAPRYNIAPTQEILTIHADENGRPLAARSHWGFKPRYAEDKARAPAPINARAEKVAESAYFRSSFAKRRAIIPAHGWYEWREEAGRKQPYRFTRRDGAPLLLAGLWTPSAKAPGKRAAIITEPARGLACLIHPRMPVVLNEASWPDWLAPKLTQRSAIRAATAALPVEQLRVYPVSPRVGNPRNDDATLIEACGEDLAPT